MQVGSTVRVLAPFNDAFPDVYTVSAINADIEGGPVYMLDGVESAFDIKYLEEV